MIDVGWPPKFSLDQDKILELLTGDRFYSNPSASLREAVLNAIDAVNRRIDIESELEPRIEVILDREDNSLSVIDNGIGMSRADVVNLFTKVGASAANAETNKRSVGEFGIGVVSYFMAGDSFLVETFDGQTQPIALGFSRAMLAGDVAKDLPVERTHRGTTLKISVRDQSVFDVLLESFPFWCRDVSGLTGTLFPDGEDLRQGGADRTGDAIEIDAPQWVERAHLSAVADPTGWNAMTGTSTVSVLYRGVFVQEFSAPGVWGIEGSLDVDPKHFQPRLNREGFIGDDFPKEVEELLRQCHPKVLENMAGHLSEAVRSGDLGKWDQKRWANLWLSVPRDGRYERAVSVWDAIFRELPAFELAVGNKWQPASLQEIAALTGDVYVASLSKTNDTVAAALRLLRNTGRNVIRGIGQDRSWMPHATRAFGTTADLITSVFSNELPPLKPIEQFADQILQEIGRVAPLFTGPPAIDLVELGTESPPTLKLGDKLVLNIQNPIGASIVAEALEENAGPSSLVGITARLSNEHLTQVAAAVRGAPIEPEILSPVRRRFIRNLLA